jgi:hypothetical protein
MKLRAREHFDTATLNYGQSNEKETTSGIGTINFGWKNHMKMRLVSTWFDVHRFFARISKHRQRTAHGIVEAGTGMQT